MIRIFFSVLGVLFTLLLVFCASFVGRLGLEMREQQPAYEKLAVDITRELSRNWTVKDIEAHYAAALAPKLRGRTAQAPFERLRSLGPLRYADNVKLHTGWTLKAMREVRSPAQAAEWLAVLLRQTVRVTFLGKFANGFADVTLELRNEGGRMKLWHLRIDSREQLRSPRQKPHQISHV